MVIVHSDRVDNKDYLVIAGADIPHLDSGPPNWEAKKAGPEEAPGRLAALNEHYGRLHWGRRRLSNHINGRQNRVLWPVLCVCVQTRKV